MTTPSMQDMATFGVFSQEPSLHVGDPYVGQLDKTPSRFKGFQLKTSPAKKGYPGFPGTLMSEFVTTNVGDPYNDPGTKERRDRIAQKKKFAAGVFIPANPPKRSTGLGSSQPMGQKLEYIPEMTDPKGPREKFRGPHLPPQILSNPPKRGSYGVPGRGIGSDWAYLPDPYEGHIAKENAEKKAAKAKLQAAAFRPASGPGGYFDNSPFISGEGAAPPKKRMPGERAKRPISVPFRPSNPSRSGLSDGTFSKFPEYMPENPDAKTLKEKEERRRAKAVGPPWRPNGGIKSTLMKSVMIV